MLTVSITIKGDKETIEKLGKLGSKLLNFQLAMRAIGQELPAYFQGQVFASQGGAIDQRWAPLSTSTRNWKAKHYPGAQTLVRTGAMQHSFAAEYPDINSVVIGNSAPYFKYHQSNAARKSKLPRRVMISSGGQVKTIIGKIIDADIKMKIAEAGL